jgi:hypothetical protein
LITFRRDVSGFRCSTSLLGSRQFREVSPDGPTTFYGRRVQTEGRIAGLSEAPAMTQAAGNR